MRKFLSILTLAWLPASSGFGAMLPSVPTSIGLALNQLYNANFEASRKTFSRYRTERPSDPLPEAFIAASYLFAELDRTGSMKGGLFTEDRSSGNSSAKQVMAPEFTVAVNSAREKAKVLLLKNPDDENALLSMCIVAGVQRDELALVEHRWRESYEFIKEAELYSNRLIKLNPKAYDAYLTKGFTEYLVASLPFYLRVFMKFDDISCTKDQGLQDLRVAATSGQYMKPFAQLLLAKFYLREKQKDETRRLLTDLTHEYPDNPTYRLELSHLPTENPARN